MTWNLGLDFLLVLLIVLFAPIGFVRGPIKELLATLGVLFGALLAEYWSRPWGGDLDSYTNIGEDPGAFVVAMAFLVSATFVIGYGLGAVLAPLPYSTPARVIGGVIASLNGILLVSFTLQYVRFFLLSDENEASLNDSLVVRLLLDQLGWILLIAGVLAVPVLIYILATGRRAYGFVEYAAEDEYFEDEFDEDAFDAYSRSSTYAQATTSETRVMPPRVPITRIDQPQSGYKSDPRARSRPTDATRPLVVPAKPAVQEIRLDNTVTEIANDTDPDMVILEYETTASDATSLEVEEAAVAEPAQLDLPEGYRRCASCNAVLPPGVSTCPVCGETNF
jgi:uncharacterized membrane protein required for colicin V production